MDIIFMDATTVKVHRQGFGSKNKGPQNIGKNVAGNGTKIYFILVKNTPISVQLTGANVHDSEPVTAMVYHLKGLGIKWFFADKGDDDDRIRQALLDLNIKVDIPLQKNRHEHRFFDQTVYKWRWRAEFSFP